MSSRRAPVKVEHPARPCRVAARYHPAALAVEYLVYVIDPVVPEVSALQDTVSQLCCAPEPRAKESAAGSEPGRPSKRVYEMDIEPLIASELPAAEAVARLLASPDWPERLSRRHVSSSQLVRLYTKIADGRRAERERAQAQLEQKPEGSALTAAAAAADVERGLPELRRSCEPKFRVGDQKRAAAERQFERQQQQQPARSRYGSKYHNLCGSLDLDEALRLSRTGNVATKLVRMPLSLGLGGGNDCEPADALEDCSWDEDTPLDFAGLL